MYRLAFVLASTVLLACSSDRPDSRFVDGGQGSDGSADVGAHDVSLLDDSQATGDQQITGDSATPACGAIVTFAAGKQPTQEIHVAVGGSDQSGDGTAAHPYGTIDRAADGAQPGTAIRVHAGTYNGGMGSVSGLSGEAGAPIWIGGMPGEARPVLAGGNQALHLSRVRYLVLHDLEIQGTSQNGINCDDGGDYGNPDATRFVVFRNLNIHDVGGSGNQDCLKLSGVDDFWVLDSTFARCGGGTSGSGVDHVGCHDGLLAGNTFSEMSGNAIQCKGGSARLEIRANTMTDAGQRAVNMGGSTDFEYFRPPLSSSQPNAEAREIEVLANVIVGGISALGFVGCVDCLAAHNTIVDSERWLLRILQETTSSGGYTFLPASNSRVINNIFYFDRAQLSTFVNIGANTDAPSFTFSHNLWFAHDNAGSSQPQLPSSETGAVVGQDPGFTDRATGDFSIADTSPAAGQGTPVVEASSGINHACFKIPPSIGAYETGTGSPP